MEKPFMDDAQRCLKFYQEYFERQTAPFSQAFESTLHVFLNGAPATSGIQDRIVGLTQTDIWNQSEALPDTPVVRFALSQILRSDVSLCIQFKMVLINLSPILLRAVIRNSQLFRASDSELYLFFKTTFTGNEWEEFFKYCDELVAKEIFEQKQLKSAESRLKYLSPFAFTFYVSMVCWELYFESVLEGESRDFSGLVDLILANKYSQSKLAELTLNEQSIHQDFSYHFVPLLMPSRSIQQRVQQSHKNFSLVIQLVASAQSLLNHQAKIDSFSVATVVPVDFSNSQVNDSCNFSDVIWERTGQKSKILWNYWFHRGLDSLVTSNINSILAVKEDQQDAVWTALTKTCRSMLQIETLFGISPERKLTSTVELNAEQCSRLIELCSNFFTDQYVKPLLSSIQNGSTVHSALAELMVDGFLINENRCPITWGGTTEKITRMADWFKTPDYPNGNPLTAKSALEFWSCNAKDFSAQNTNQATTKPRLHEKPIIRFGDYLVQLPFFCSETDNFTALVNNLRRYNRFRPELKSETSAAENNLAELLRGKGFSVLVGYEPEPSSDGSVGEVDLICARDGLVLIIEMKTTYVRGKRSEIWLHRNNTLRKASWQLQRKQQVLLKLLQTNVDLQKQLALSSTPTNIHSWIVDTSIEFDGQYIDDFLVVSREVIEVVLRDELHLLNPIDVDASSDATSFFKEGFTASRFVEVIERQLLWSDLTERYNVIKSWNHQQEGE